MTTHAIDTDELTKSFDSGVAVDHLTLDVREGEVLALLGPNGAGKTTTMRLLNGVLEPNSGRCQVLGIDPSVDGDAVRARTGVLTENAGLDDRLTALENLIFIGAVRGFDEATTRQRSLTLLEQFGMADRADELVRGFSTGQRKRVALARALLHDPEVLFLDEPTSGLDPAATRDVVELIQQLTSERGRTVVLCTHFLGEADLLADRMAVLHHGRLEAFGTTEELAAELWRGLEAEVDLGAPAPAEVLDGIAGLGGVWEVVVTDQGMRVRVEDRDVLPRLVADLVARGVPVYAAMPRPPTLQDVYFAIEARMLTPDHRITARAHEAASWA